ncbi:YggS family pyridoxal phosphate-dependent enzyme [archaeon]|jgi:PLP dependent protein|nr:YggS family pyridoxal phosphate-dependent enzyme [archaeon]MBT4022803.1 YggS family pyridoxal phosphate-dependent enzyme [archaeon]MBT4273003.1 YggS family pyridoxal phosphate-dependent enzyme [archaeon]MBT4460906.1 YggS family pyridoxal phosphate-dependent enzyme [archaeon]MBT4858122.1 YggS family pyridoxal phosphate-dependent enzyme [archaeon]
MMKSNIQKIIQEIGKAKLVAVSKKKSVLEIKQAINAGIKIIGENRIQKAQEKYNELNEFFKENHVEFHFVGHLQSNKTKKAVEMFDLIQTVDSLKLAQEINNRAKEINKIQRVLIQINIGEEKQKFGIKPEKTVEFVAQIKKYKNIKIKGLMCIHPFGEDPIPYFKRMKKIFDSTQLEILSMGMSSDYKTAIEQGSNMIRVGTKIFGERK